MPQLDKATFFSQLFVIGILFVVTFLVFAIVVLPELYKIQRVREFSLDEAEWEAYVVSTVFALTNYTKRTSVELVAQSILDAVESLDDDSFAIIDEIDFFDELLVADETSEEEFEESYAMSEIDDEGFMFDSDNPDVILDTVLANFALFYNFELEYFNAAVCSCLDIGEVVEEISDDVDSSEV